ncbi:hypothetical protein IQ260_02515 [Leptolyngbya cf. ectocarpi LEGE 11479]|uniref:Carbohydrate-binding domain-containing protein n=1 Tax=Leptolyngbya cf. ectocarpi LEGE 11479 TaxID=1828722 RepID=A0A928WZ53_LEPEC|nr:hypothetical protein [Leptolyngbya ectocarpi]MBE9065522.1 hypothetical protein [Leptolyngbya cf. ectocarpi LEGE 11479]
MLRTTALLATSLLLTAPNAMAAGLSPSSHDAFERLDDLVLPVNVVSGSCPEQVRFWQETRREFEAGENNGTMLDVSWLSRGKTEFIDSQEYSVTFRAPLIPEFYSCVGNLTESDEHSQSLHHLWFGQGYVYFRFDIGAIAPAPDENWYFATITHQEIVGQYPYVRWAVGD